MTIVRETDRGFVMFTSAAFLESDYDTAAWASKHVHPHPWHRWILAKYVEADNANDNSQYWSLDDLKKRKDTIINTPMNVDHKAKEVVGCWQAAELMYPDAADKNPYIETLGVFWERNNRDLYKEVKSAYEMGRLYVSMECESESVTCGSCNSEFAYEGPVSNNYCSHINSREAHRKFNNTTFLAGALIMPSNRPGWKGASVKDLAKLTTDEEKDQLLKEVAYSNPEGSPADWEADMWTLQMEYLKFKATS